MLLTILAPAIRWKRLTVEEHGQIHRMLLCVMTTRVQMVRFTITMRRAFFWFARITIVKTAGTDVLGTDVPGDNVAGQGSTPTTWNLQP